MRTEVLVGPERRRRWSVDAKRRIVREAFAPDARVSDVARRRDVSRSQIYQWRAELKDERWHEAGTEIVGFVPVDFPVDVPVDVAVSTAFPPSATGAAEAVIEIGLPGGRSLRVASSLSMAELQRLIRAVEGA
jgi:transposase